MQTANPPENRPTEGTSVGFLDFTSRQKLADCYVLIRKIAEDAGVPIWLAYDEIVGKEVSLHFIPPGTWGDEKAKKDLQSQIKRSRQLIHPNILRVYELIEGAGWAAISMESFQGESLAALRRKTPGGFFEVAEIKHWLAQLCDTLKDAHTVGFFHGDIRLENVFVEKDGRLLVANFGLRHCNHQAAWQSASNLEHVSSQQIDGHHPTAADDVYSIGVLVHELLVGHPPFTGEDAAEKIRKCTSTSIVERRSQLAKAGGPIPHNWEKTVAACLEKSAERRPKSMAEFAGYLGLDKLANELALPRGGDTARVAKNISQTKKAPLITPTIPIAAKEATSLMQEGVSETKQPASVTRHATPVLNQTVATEAAAITKQTTAAHKETWPKTATATPLTQKHEPVFNKIAQSKRSAVPFMAALPSEVLEEKASTQTKGVEPKAELATTIQNSIPDHYPNLNPRRPTRRFAAFVAAVLLVAVCLYAVLFGGKPKKESAGAIAPAKTELPSDAAELTAVTYPIAEQTSERLPEISMGKAHAVSHVDGASVRQPPPPVVSATVEKPDVETPLTFAAKAKPTPTSTPISRQSTPAVADPRRPVADKPGALETARKAAEAAEKAQQDLLKQKGETEAAVADTTKALEEKSNAAIPILKASEDIEALRQKREEEMQAAELAAREARKMAAEKVRLADDAKKAIESIATQHKEKLAAKQKVEAELNELKKTLGQKQKVAAETARLVDEAKARRDGQIAAVKQMEQELAQAKAAADKAAEDATKKAAEDAAKMELTKKAQEEKRAKIQQEKEEAKRSFDEQMKALEAKLKMIEEAAAIPVLAPSPQPPPLSKTAAPAPAPSAPAVTENRGLAGPASDANLLAKADPPKSLPMLPAESKSQSEPAGGAFTNSLGMKFIPIGDVQFSVWQTRFKDFEVFANATGLKSNLWRDPGFKQSPDHPVVNVTWMEAMAFCKWLTFKEQRDGSLAPNRAYRLPTDIEWSKAVGLPEESGRTPEARDMGIPDVYPWGQQWPPPLGAGNYTGEETGSDVAIKGYEDGYAWTAPVGSFAPNKYGLYDMGGNVWQWVMDAWNAADPKAKVIRGASWYNGALKLSLLSSCRVQALQDSSTDNCGFRCVLVDESAKPVKK